MTQKDIIDAYCEIRRTNMSIPDDVLDFMKEASILQLNKICNHEPFTLKSKNTYCIHCGMKMQVKQ